MNRKGYSQMKRLRQQFRRFRRDETGTLLAEGVIMLPIMFWALMAMFVFWDAFRTINTVQKVSYTVSDVISRRRAEVSPAYLEGLGDLFNFLLDRGQTGRIRVTSLTWTEHDDTYRVLWSYSPDGAMSAHTNASVGAIRPNLPVMADGDSVVLVETQVDYRAAFEMGLGQKTISQFIVTRPRLVSRICFQNIACG